MTSVLTCPYLDLCLPFGHFLSVFVLKILFGSQSLFILKVVLILLFINLSSNSHFFVCLFRVLPLLILASILKSLKVSFQLQKVG
jgi:hypothetical protein